MQPKNKKPWLLIALALLVFWLIAGLIVLKLLGVSLTWQNETEFDTSPDVIETSDSELSQEHISKLAYSISNEDLSEIQVQSEKIMDQIEDRGERAVLQLTLASTLYRTGTETEREDALRLVRNLAEDSTLDPIARAYAINLMVGFAFDDKASFGTTDFPYYLESPELNEMEPEYLSMLETATAESHFDAVRVLMEYSQMLHPTAISKITNAFWYASILEYTDYLNLSDDVVSEYISNVETLVAEADQLKVEEKAQQDRHPLSDWHDVNYLFWKANTLAAASASGRISYDFIPVFDEVVDLIKQKGLVENNIYSDFIPDTYFFYAHYLYSVYGEEEADRIDAQLVKLVDLLNSKKMNGTDSSFVDYLDSLKTYQDRKPGEMTDSYYLSITNLVAVSPTFKNYLEANGWIFN